MGLSKERRRQDRGPLGRVEKHDRGPEPVLRKGGVTLLILLSDDKNLIVK